MTHLKRSNVAEGCRLVRNVQSHCMTFARIREAADDQRESAAVCRQTERRFRRGGIDTIPSVRRPSCRRVFQWKFRRRGCSSQRTDNSSEHRQHDDDQQTAAKKLACNHAKRPCWHDLGGGLSKQSACPTEKSSGRDSRHIQANRESLRCRIVSFVLNVGFMPPTPVARGVQAPVWQPGVNWGRLRISAKNGS